MSGSARPRVGVVMHRSFTPRQVLDLARRAEAEGVDDVWLVEDCFFTTGPSLAAAILASTDDLHVGIGILPAVARNAAITAMEIATLEGLGPGRVTVGIGHGVQDWMEQIGARPASPVGTLATVITTVRRLLLGEEVTVDEQGVRLDAVRLDSPPSAVPNILAGVRGPRSLAMAGERADGVVLAEPATASDVASALDHAGRPDDFEVVAYAPWCVTDDPAEAHRIMASWLSEVLATRPVRLSTPERSATLRDALRLGSEDGLAPLPSEIWSEVGAVGTVDDAHRYVDGLAASGAGTIAFFPAPSPDQAHLDVAAIGAYARHTTNP